MVKNHHFEAISVSISYALVSLRATHECSYGQHKQVFVGDTEWRERKCQV